MALKKTVTTIHGINVQDAYHRVESVSLQSKEAIGFHVRSYVNADSTSFESKMFACKYDLNGANPIKQAYDHVKTLPEFSGAIDC